MYMKEGIRGEWLSMSFKKMMFFLEYKIKLLFIYLLFKSSVHIENIKQVTQIIQIKYYQLPYIINFMKHVSIFYLSQVICS